ncbi:hypothetical protein [Sphingobium sp. ZW T5_29]|uniref:hypothetical protein n=1 Tax=Sphingobium sp. ZW T5_29 TaxID=3378077 RepID=UPI0038519292
MRKLSLATVLIAPALALAGCTANDPTFGGAVRNNYAMQVINPDPQYEGALVEGGDGARSAAAVERYRTDKVKATKSIRTTQGSGGGSGSGSGGGSN